MGSKRERIEQFRRQLNARWIACKQAKKKEQPYSAPPRYDDIYWKGVAWLDAIARGEICEECGGKRVDACNLAENHCHCGDDR